MILFKKWAKHKVKSYIYCVNQLLSEKHHKKWGQECKQNQSLLFNFCNIFDLMISRTEKMAWRPPVFKPYFYIFFYNDKLRKIERNFMDILRGPFHKKNFNWKKYGGTGLISEKKKGLHVETNTASTLSSSSTYKASVFRFEIRTHLRHLFAWP